MYPQKLIHIKEKEKNKLRNVSEKIYSWYQNNKYNGEKLQILFGLS